MEVQDMLADFIPDSLRNPQSAHSVLLLKLMRDLKHKEEISARFRYLWEKSGMTYYEIAEALGLKERSVAAWAIAEHAPKYENAKKFAKFFKVDLVWFWDGAGRAPAGAPQRLSKRKQRPATPNLMDQLDAKDQLDRIEKAVEAILQAVAPSGVVQAVAGAAQVKPESDSQPARERASSAKKPRAAKRRAV